MENLQKLNYDTIVLGGTLEALIHSYAEGIPLIMVNPQIPFYRDLDPKGRNKSKIWDRLSFYLSYVGLNPIGQKAKSYRIEENNIITIFGKTSYKVEIQYKNLIRYDQVKPTEKLRTFDYLKVENISALDIEKINKIKTGQDFIGEFYTMIDDRITDIIAVSSLTQEQLNKEEYSEVYARLKSTEILKANGIIGRVEPLKNGSQRTHKIKTTTLKREILFDNIQQENKILLEEKDTKNDLMKNLVKILGSPYVA